MPYIIKSPDLLAAGYLISELWERGFICTTGTAIEYLDNNRYEIELAMADFIACNSCDDRAEQRVRY